MSKLPPPKPNAEVEEGDMANGDGNIENESGGCAAFGTLELSRNLPHSNDEDDLKDPPQEDESEDDDVVKLKGPPIEALRPARFSKRARFRDGHVDDDDIDDDNEEGNGNPPSSSSQLSRGKPVIDDVVELLSKDPELVRIVERGMEAILESTIQEPRQSDCTDEEDSKPSPVDKDEISRRVVRAILLDSARTARVEHASNTPRITTMKVANKRHGRRGRKHKSEPANASIQSRTTTTAGVSSVSSMSSVAALPPPSALGAAPATIVNSSFRSCSRSRSPATATPRGGRGTVSNLENAPPPVKSVSFSSISVPHVDVEDDAEQDEHGESITHRRSASSSPPPPQFPSLLQETYYARTAPGIGGSSMQSTGSSGRSSPMTSLPPSPMLTRSGRSRSRSRSRSPAPRGAVYYSSASSVTSTHTGEATASGDSSVTSYHTTGSTAGPAVSFASAAFISGPQVHFSAMNPNPQLPLDGGVVNEGSNDTEARHTTTVTFHPDEDVPSSAGPRVSFTLGRAVSWEDDLRGSAALANGTAGSSSRASVRSGLSSPSIEPALSPLNRSRSPVQIQFSSAIETITEAAARLRSEQIDDTNDDDNGGSGVLVGMETSGPISEAAEGGAATSGSGTPIRSSTRVVHFSALRDVAVVDTDAAAAASINSATIGTNNSSARASPRLRQREADRSMQGESSPTLVHIQPSVSGSDGVNIVQFDDDMGLEREQETAVVGGADNIDLPSESTSPPLAIGTTTTRTYSESEMECAAEQLRRAVRRAEHTENGTLESAFAHFDWSHNGRMTPMDLQLGLSRLGESFACFSFEECSALLEYLSRSSGQSTSSGVSLLEFYREMTQRSPPLIMGDRTSELLASSERSASFSAAIVRSGESEVINSPVGPRVHRPIAIRSDIRTSGLASSPTLHGDASESRLRAIVLSAEAEDGMPLESTFELLDPSTSGHITATNFVLGLRRLGRRRTELSISDEQKNEALDTENNEFFSLISDDDCEQLVALFGTDDGLVSLSEFYRFIGRRKPPRKNVESVSSENSHPNNHPPRPPPSGGGGDSGGNSEHPQSGDGCNGSSLGDGREGEEANDSDHGFGGQETAFDAKCNISQQLPLSSKIRDDKIRTIHAESDDFTDSGRICGEVPSPYKTLDSILWIDPSDEPSAGNTEVRLSPPRHRKSEMSCDMAKNSIEVDCVESGRVSLGSSVFSIASFSPKALTAELADATDAPFPRASGGTNFKPMRGAPCFLGNMAREGLFGESPNSASEATFIVSPRSRNSSISRGIVESRDPSHDYNVAGPMKDVTLTRKLASTIFQESGRKSPSSIYSCAQNKQNKNRPLFQEQKMRPTLIATGTPAIPLRKTEPSSSAHLGIFSLASDSTTRKVRFAKSILSEVRERPRSSKNDAKSLFYSVSDIDRFEDELGRGSLQEDSPHDEL